MTQSTAQSRASITVQYDAGSKTYTLTSGPTTSAFGEGARQADRFAGERRWVKTGSTLSSALTIATQPYHGRLPQNRYVALGYWQENSVAGGVQQTQFSSFTFGSPTPSSGMPRTGTGHWLTDVFGLFMKPGDELRIISADGDFDVDFAAGAYTAYAPVEQLDYISGGGVTGALYLRSGGQLSSNGTFSGILTYGGTTGVLTGSMAGSFYGPNAEELGGVFNASGPGGTLTGSFTGQRSATLASTSDGIANVSLTAPVKEQRLFNNQASRLSYQVRENEPGLSTAGIGTTSGFGTITTLGVGEASINSYGYRPDPLELTGNQRPNFKTYAKTIAGDPTTISFYQIGSANTEMALTYTSFFSWVGQRNGAIATGQQIYDTNVYFLTYGLKTPENMVNARTGTARYDGVAYGLAVDPTGAKYDISGTSRFDVDFSALNYSGSLTLSRASGGAPTSIGTFGFSGIVGLGQMAQADLPRGSNWGGSNWIQPQFYGPMGQEIGATFQMMTGPFEDPTSLFIAGATVAKSSP